MIAEYVFRQLRSSVGEAVNNTARTLGPEATATSDRVGKLALETLNKLGEIGKRHPEDLPAFQDAFRQVSQRLSKGKQELFQFVDATGKGVVEDIQAAYARLSEPAKQEVNAVIQELEPALRQSTDAPGFIELARGYGAAVGEGLAKLLQRGVMLP